MAKKATYITELKKALNKIDLKDLESLSDFLVFSRDNRIFICGNGGSACTAQHIAEDLQKMCGFNITCLTDNIGVITAYANDISYDAIFSGQLEAMATEGDILIVISGSGNSKNILRAIDCANKRKMNVVAIVGTNGGEVKDMRLDKLIHINTDMQRFEDCSLIVGHIITMNIYGN
jgi:D-sedoheptulose 7-phosphate isomerase